MVRLALSAAFRKGHSGIEIRAAVERWLRAAPPERVVVVDPRRETLDLVAPRDPDGPGRPRLGLHPRGARARAGARLGRAPPRPALPRGEGGAGRARGAARDGPRRGLRRRTRRSSLALPAGATVVVVSSSPILLQIAAAFVGGLRGDEVLVETRLLGRRAEWRRLLPVADVVFADALAAPAVREARPRRAAGAAPPRREGSRARPQGAQHGRCPRPRRILACPSLPRPSSSWPAPRPASPRSALWDAWPERRFVATPAPCLRHAELVERLRALEARHPGRLDARGGGSLRPGPADPPGDARERAAADPAVVADARRRALGDAGPPRPRRHAARRRTRRSPARFSTASPS